MYYNNILLTGATGILGQHILFELLKVYHTTNNAGKIYVIIRSNKTETSLLRLKTLLSGDFIPDYLKKYSLEEHLSKIEVLDIDIASNIDLSLLPFTKEDNVCVIHCAAYTNLVSSAKVEQQIKITNYEASINLLHICANFAAKFVFISTAFSCGIREGLIAEDYLQYDQNKFRNPYERYKYLAEREIVSICREKGITSQILRPSIISGRLIDAPLYYTPKFDVFYGYSKFFYEIVKTPLANLPLRVVANINEAVSNVISVDYVAKAITKAIHKNDISQMTIAHSKSIPLSFSFYQMMQASGYDKYQIVSEIPSEMNPLETAYYIILGNLSTPYLYDNSFEFDTATVRKIMIDTPEPDVKGNTKNMLDFAKKYGFNHLQR